MLQGNPVQRKGQTHNKTKIQWKWKLLMSNSSRPCGLYSTRNSPGQNTGVGSCSLFKRIFPTQRWNPGLPRCGWILYWLSHQGSPRILERANYSFSIVSSWTMNPIGVSYTTGGFFTRWAPKEAKPKKVKVLVAQALYNLMHCSPPGFLVLGILKARTLESVAIPSSRGSSQSRDQTQISCIAGRFFTTWATLRKSINCYQDIRLWPLKGADLKKGNTWKAKVVKHWWFLN